MGHPVGEQDEGDDSGRDVPYAFDGKVGIGGCATCPDGQPEAGGGRAGSQEKPCAYEDDAQACQSSQPVTDVGENHGLPPFALRRAIPVAATNISSRTPDTYTA